MTPSEKWSVGTHPTTLTLVEAVELGGGVSMVGVLEKVAERGGAAVVEAGGAP